MKTETYYETHTVLIGALKSERDTMLKACRETIDDIKRETLISDHTASCNCYNCKIVKRLAGAISKVTV